MENPGDLRKSRTVNFKLWKNFIISVFSGLRVYSSLHRIYRISPDWITLKRFPQFQRVLEIRASSVPNSKVPWPQQN